MNQILEMWKKVGGAGDNPSGDVGAYGRPKSNRWTHLPSGLRALQGTINTHTQAHTGTHTHTHTHTYVKLQDLRLGQSPSGQN